MSERPIEHHSQNRTPWPVLGKAPIPALFGGLLIANALAWLWAWSAFTGRPALLGTAVLAWMFGLRHAIDADHIAAIDNVVRKLMHDGKKPLLAGTYFSLGHSTVVALASAGVAATAAGTHSEFGILRLLGGSTFGTAISAAFLLTIALLNITTLSGVWQRFRAAERGDMPHSPALQSSSQRGLLVRLLSPMFRAVSHAWHMFPLGFLFGLGFDTATEIGLLGLSAAEAAHGMSPWQTMVFPALFAAGMTLVDSADSVAMVGAYGWALHQPRRKLWYDLIITLLSVFVAVLVGGLELLNLLTERFDVQGRLWSAVVTVSASGTRIGLAIILMFLLVWGTSVAMFRWRTRPALALRAAARRH